MNENKNSEQLTRRPNTGRLVDHSNPLVTVGYKELPPQAIAEFVPNPLAQSMLPKEFQYLCDPKFLLQHVYFATPLETAPYRKLITFGSGRSLEGILGGTSIPFAERFIGRNIDLKGGFRSGGLYQREHLSDDSDDIDTPFGFVNEEHLNTVMHVSNELLSQKFRTSLVLGGVILRNQEILQWLKQKNFPSTIIERAEYDLQHNVSGNLAVFWRLGGVSERWQTTLRGVSNDESDIVLSGKEGSRLFARGLVKAARIFYEEMQLFPQHQIYLIDISNIQNVLYKIATRKPISLDELKKFKEVYVSLIIENISNLRKLYKLGTDIQSVPSIHRLEDLDLAMFLYDLENTLLVKDSKTNLPVISSSSFSEPKALKYNNSLTNSIDNSLNEASPFLTEQNQVNTSFSIFENVQRRITALYKLIPQSAI